MNDAKLNYTIQRVLALRERNALEERRITHESTELGEGLIVWNPADSIMEEIEVK
jgi:hypothetical protein